jgi:branched-subunit amino acid aminotransferase/4-amino-4-deoxychorismate lyase
LPGIVRGLLLESLPGALEARVACDDLARASEVWLASSGVRVAPIRAVRGIPAEFPGSLGPQFQRAAAALARREAEYAAAWRASDYHARAALD